MRSLSILFKIKKKKDDTTAVIIDHIYKFGNKSIYSNIKNAEQFGILYYQLIK